MQTIELQVYSLSVDPGQGPSVEISTETSSVVISTDDGDFEIFNTNKSYVLSPATSVGVVIDLTTLQLQV